MGSTLTWKLIKFAMGGDKNGYNGTKHNATKHFCMELEAYKICEK